jgi:hypothetical protein
LCGKDFPAIPLFGRVERAADGLEGKICRVLGLPKSNPILAVKVLKSKAF